MSATIPTISDAVLEVMKVLWRLGEATAQQIVDELAPTSDWKPKTIHTLITRLVGKSAVTAERTEGKAYLYRPLITQERYHRHANAGFLQKLYDGSLQRMLTAFARDHSLTQGDIDELRKLIDEQE